MTDVAPDLDALVEAARIPHAQRRSMDAAAAEVLRLLAEADGALPLDDEEWPGLLYGWASDVTDDRGLTAVFRRLGG